MSDAGNVRLDKWLWAARFYKTRSLATAAVSAGEVRVARERVKPARDVKTGDELQIRRGDDVMDVVVRGLSSVRGPAPVAQGLYEESEESRQRRARAAERRALVRDPALDLKGRPTKRDARVLRRLRGGE
ncbi:MAG TPA: RNA-binding S4 domain-containing protein [Burkholderiaceae bacterium]|nr:RNA-binding S4 domain-containing protein [Burkholderiaceae bacterium]